MTDSLGQHIMIRRFKFEILETRVTKDQYEIHLHGKMRVEDVHSGGPLEVSFSRSSPIDYVSEDQFIMSSMMTMLNHELRENTWIGGVRQDPHQFGDILPWLL